MNNNEYFENSSMYNYDINPLIDNFSFYDFINSKDDLGGFIVITNKQYIIGYNSSFGKGTHLSSYARVMKDLSGGGYISNQMDATFLALNCKKTNITARINYEKIGNGSYCGGISFDLTLLKDGISKEQLEEFKLFYDDYNEEIESISSKLGIQNFYVEFKYKDTNGAVKRHISNNLDELYKYLCYNVNRVSVPSEEIILSIKRSKI